MAAASLTSRDVQPSPMASTPFRPPRRTSTGICLDAVRDAHICEDKLEVGDPLSRADPLAEAIDRKNPERDLGHSWPPLTGDKSRGHRLEQIRLRRHCSPESRLLQLWVAARLLGTTVVSPVPSSEVPPFPLQCVASPLFSRSARSSRSSMLARTVFAVSDWACGAELGCRRLSKLTNPDDPRVVSLAEGCKRLFLCERLVCIVCMLCTRACGC